jgi:peptidyl-prolyl cis-trans isomerase A (cyclophilin A)
MQFQRDFAGGWSEMIGVNRFIFIRFLVASIFCVLFVPLRAAQPADPVVELKTSMGTITLQLDATHAPLSTSNFLSYVDQKFYDGTIFHRIIPGFMVQGGGFTPEMTEKPTGAPIHNESTNGLKNLRGTISMARTSDPDSGTSQFFLNLVDNAALDSTGDAPGYAVFGKIIGGMDVLEKMGQVATTTKGEYENVPVEPVILISARRKS